jgi:hypothetical protein
MSYEYLLGFDILDVDTPLEIHSAALRRREDWVGISYTENNVSQLSLVMVREDVGW